MLVVLRRTGPGHPEIRTRGESRSTPARGRPAPLRPRGPYVERTLRPAERSAAAAPEPRKARGGAEAAARSYLPGAARSVPPPGDAGAALGQFLRFSGQLSYFLTSLFFPVLEEMFKSSLPNLAEGRAGPSCRSHARTLPSSHARLHPAASLLPPPTPRGWTRGSGPRARGRPAAGEHPYWKSMRVTVSVMMAEL